MRNPARLGRFWLQRLAVSFFVCLGLAQIARAQEHRIELPASTPVRPVQVHVTADQPAQISALTLADCVHIGLERQPTMAALRASLAAAYQQRQALDNMVCASLLSKEMGYRKQQACLGITIAQAGVETAEWETTYAITRCYYTAIYARKQELVAKGLLEKLEAARKNAESLVKKGDPDSLVTQVDVDKLTLNLDLVQLRLIEASTGVSRAKAALREAIGLRYDTEMLVAMEEFPALGEELNREALVQIALSRRGELVQASCAAQITDLEVCAQNTGCLLPFKMTFAAASDIHARPIPQGTSNGTYRPSAIGIEMPTTLVGKKTDRVARAQDFNSRAAAVVEKTEGLIALETEDAFYQWQSSASQVKTLTASAPRSAKLAELISGRFDNGKVSSEDYLRARTLEDQMQAQLNEALFHHALALAALERVTSGGYTPIFRHQAYLPRQ